MRCRAKVTAVMNVLKIAAVIFLGSLVGVAVAGFVNRNNSEANSWDSIL